MWLPTDTGLCWVVAVVRRVGPPASQTQNLELKKTIWRAGCGAQHGHKNQASRSQQFIKALSGRKGRHYTNVEIGQLCGAWCWLDRVVVSGHMQQFNDSLWIQTHRLDRVKEGWLDWPCLEKYIAPQRWGAEVDVKLVNENVMQISCNCGGRL